MKRPVLQRSLRALRGCAAFGLVLACNVPEPPGSTGGIKGLSPSADAECGRGFVVVESNYQSTNVALLDMTGRVLSESLVSSGARPVGIDAALSGDVVPVSQRASGLRLPLVDRAFGAPKVAWVDLENGGIVQVLRVATGFPSNPQDYSSVSEHKAYLSRFGDNPESGKVPFDQGSDLLIVDPSAQSILGRIDLRSALADEAVDNLPRPGRMLLLDRRLLVLLATLPQQGFTATTSSRLAVIDTLTDTLEATLVLEGLRDCTGLALSPSRRTVAVFCSALNGQKGESQIDASGIALVGVDGDLTLERVLSGPLVGSQPVGSSGAFVSESALLVTSFGAFDPLNQPIAQDSLLRLDLTSGAREVLLRSAGTPFTLGGVACAPACRVCMVADAGRDGGVVHGYELDDNGAVLNETPIKVETRIGLPPRSLGRF